jgi:hypothetical protein
MAPSLRATRWPNSSTSSTSPFHIPYSDPWLSPLRPSLDDVWAMSAHSDHYSVTFQRVVFYYNLFRHLGYIYHHLTRVFASHNCLNVETRIEK